MLKELFVLFLFLFGFGNPIVPRLPRHNLVGLLNLLSYYYLQFLAIHYMKAIGDALAHACLLISYFHQRGSMDEKDLVFLPITLNTLLRLMEKKINLGKKRRLIEISRHYPLLTIIKHKIGH
jgi:hypothetical protein